MNSNQPDQHNSAVAITAPLPDVRVKVAAGWSQRESIVTQEVVEARPILSVTVQNHSPVPVFMGNIFLETKANGVILPNGDFITNQYQKRQELQPGDSFMLTVNPTEIERHLDKELVCAAVRDQVDRVYRSSPKEFVQAIDDLFNYYVPRFPSKDKSLEKS